MKRHETLLKRGGGTPSLTPTVIANDSEVVGRIYQSDKNNCWHSNANLPPNPPPREGKAAFTLAEGATHVATLRKQRKSAFTLAEVLITLGIIGVVAAITMPAIIANVKDKALKSALEKSQSSLINGYKQLMARESVFKVSNLPIMSCARDASCFSPWHKSTFKVVDDTTSGLTGSALPEEYAMEDGYNSPFSWSDVPYLFRTADGMSYGVEIDDGYETFSVYADTNGKKSPNTVCKDMLKFRISGIGNISNVCGELAESKCSINNLDACSYDQCIVFRHLPG